MATHYLRLNPKNLVIHAFSDEFESPQKKQKAEKDMIFAKDAERHFHLDIIDETGLYKWRWDVAKKKLIEDKGKSQTAEVLANHKTQFKAERSRLLNQSDWTQLPDVAESPQKKAWAAYRQSLRGMPATTDFDFEKPAWPEQPEK